MPLRLPSATRERTIPLQKLKLRKNGLWPFLNPARNATVIGSSEREHGPRLVNSPPPKTINSVIIFVDDDCPGIPENEHQNVMKPFYRIDKSRGQNKSGVGLGLSISNDIIRSHGGNISLEKSPLNGLRVKISLPL